jgi:hypothetical protein
MDIDENVSDFEELFCTQESKELPYFKSKEPPNYKSIFIENENKKNTNTTLIVINEEHHLPTYDSIVLKCQ